MDTTLRFTLNGSLVAPGLPPTMTLLDALRGPLRLTGTKEGCAEGDCGACTVVIEEPRGTRRPANACLIMLGQLHGSAVRTIEGIPDTIPRLIAETDATQCGFCTPGIVMSAWALAATDARDDDAIHDALAGNLCRCTGYRPIVDAFRALPHDVSAAILEAATDAARFESFHVPATLTGLLALRAALPDAVLLAGGTDLGLLASEKRRPPAQVIHVTRVPELTMLRVEAEAVTVGAAVTYADLLDALPPDLAPFGALLRRLGSAQIRAMGTLGGNLGTASPIGDALPPLVSLGAQARLAGRNGERVLAVEEFLTGYRTNALRADEVILDLVIPRPRAGALFACEKIAKRHDQDIATVGLSAVLPLHNGVVSGARIALGGVAARVVRAPAAEAALEGRAPAKALDDACAALADGIAPICDARGSAAYRRLVAANLLRRIVMEHAGTPARVHA